MQNKPNFQKSQIRLTISIAKTCAKMDTWSRGKNKPNQTQSCSPLEIHPQRILAGPSANLRRRRNKINQTCFRFFKSPQNSPKTACFSHFFSHFLSFSRVFARFHRQSARLCAPFYPKNRIPSPKINPNANFPPSIFLPAQTPSSRPISLGKCAPVRCITAPGSEASIQTAR